MVPYFKDVHSPDPQVEKALDVMRAWDFENRRDRAGATIFESIFVHLQEAIWSDELGADLAKDVLGTGPSQRLAVSEMLGKPDAVWWDDVTTPGVQESEADILLKASTAAVAELSARLGGEPASWTWGRVHTATFRNQSLGESGFAPLESLFNRGPVEVDGGSAIVNATGYGFATRYEVRALPSMRMLVDLDTLSNSRTMNTTGQSGHPYHPQYDEWIDAWRNVQYHPMLWDRTAVDANAEATLILEP